MLRMHSAGTSQQFSVMHCLCGASVFDGKHSGAQVVRCIDFYKHIMVTDQAAW